VVYINENGVPKDTGTFYNSNCTKFNSPSEHLPVDEVVLFKGGVIFK
jgi:hypothetical protein